MKKLGSIFFKLIVYGSILLIVAKIIEFDMLKQSIKEDSLIEHSQEFILLITAIIAAITGSKHIQIRIFAYVFSAFSAVSFIREMDAFLENNLFDKAWQLFALIVILPTLFFLYKNFSKFVDQINSISNTFSFGLIFLGTIIVHVFSRLYGRGKIWKALMTEEKYIRAVKDASEEGIELLGYSIVLMGTIELFLFLKNKNNHLE